METTALRHKPTCPCLPAVCQSPPLENRVTPLTFRSSYSSETLSVGEKDRRMPFYKSTPGQSQTSMDQIDDQTYTQKVAADLRNLQT